MKRFGKAERETEIEMIKREQQKCIIYININYIMYN